MAKREWDFETGKTTLSHELHPKFDFPKRAFFQNNKDKYRLHFAY